MTWVFVLVLVLCALYLHGAAVRSGGAVLSTGVFFALVALCVELVNPILDIVVLVKGPLWIASDSVWLLAPGLPVEKLLIYLVVGTWWGEHYGDVSEERPEELPVVPILAVAMGLSALEYVLNYTEALVWVRPWLWLGSFSYHAGLLALSNRFHGARPQIQRVSVAALVLAVLALAAVQPGPDQGFPRVHHVAGP